MMSKINDISCYRCFGDPVTGGNRPGNDRPRCDRLLPPALGPVTGERRRKWLRCNGFLHSVTAVTAVTGV
jgi:hypothetical protein